MSEFMEYCVMSLKLLSSIHKWKALLLRGQVQAFYFALSGVLYNVHRNQASTSGVERITKMNESMINQLRCQLNDDRVEKKPSIAHNWCQLNGTHLGKRSAFDMRIARQRCNDSVTNNTCVDINEHEVNENGDKKIAETAIGDSLQGINKPSCVSNAGDYELVTAGGVEMAHNLLDLKDTIFMISTSGNNNCVNFIAYFFLKHTVGNVT